MRPALKKYKNPPKVTEIESAGSKTENDANTKLVSETMSGLDENSSVTLTGLKKLHHFPLPDIEKVQNICDRNELKIFRAYLGHSEAIQGFQGGNNTKMISILQIVHEFSKSRCSLMENAQNALIENIVYARFGFGSPVPYIKHDLKNKPDEEVLFKWYLGGVSIDKNLAYEILGGEPAADNKLQKTENSIIQKGI